MPCQAKEKEWKSGKLISVLILQDLRLNSAPVLYACSRASAEVWDLATAEQKEEHAELSTRLWVYYYHINESKFWIIFLPSALWYGICGYEVLLCKSVFLVGNQKTDRCLYTRYIIPVHHKGRFEQWEWSSWGENNIFGDILEKRMFLYATRIWAERECNMAY